MEQGTETTAAPSDEQAISTPQNRLGEAASAYLRSARHQPVAWQEWGPEAFARAQAERKAVLLDIGAVWCHWCHVMDRESYENSGVAALINDHFIAIKVDRDERPDVDARYQAAVAAICGQGGWPLTAFLTPEGRPYFGGTYFPPDDRYGRPGFPRVLASMAEAYYHQQDEVEESAGSVMLAIEQNESFSGRAGTLDESLLQKIIAAILRQFDPRHGGFGAQPKFPHAAALHLLIDTATRPGPLAARAREVTQVTLERMAAGGIHDQLAGGFHRYSVDERWIVPHFEKMAYDNSELLRVYAHGFQSSLDPRLAHVAASTMRWMDEWLSDRERGGFYASQDADDSLEDDGDYFTWTRAEAEAVLLPEEFEVAAAVYDLRAVGDMHHNPAKNVLRAAAQTSEVAERLGRPEETVERQFAAAREKLHAARLTRRTPYVDQTVYTGWNGLCISAYLAAGRALGLPEAVRFALKTLERVLAAVWLPNGRLLRVVAYGEGQGTPKPIPAVLDDYAFLGNAALDAWETSGDLRYFEAANQIAEALLEHFYDPAEGGFFDTAQGVDVPERIGALSTRRKPLQDAPTPAGNPTAANLLLRLELLTGNALYGERARRTLELFAGVVEHFGLHAGSYAQALRRAITPAVLVCVIGDDALAEDLSATATARFLVNKSVVRLRHEQLDSLPPALAETLPQVPGVRDGSVAVVCKGFRCLPPVRDRESLLRMLHEDL